ncbi:MAG: hypothetical protein M1828_005153 [Chrysothrix sp. TS-e1954]|nr:MAG: hypothetical protein M1828_005153 [Chrysothrix sp. TS-e1954]
MNHASPYYPNHNSTNGAFFNGNFDQTNTPNSLDPAAFSVNPNNLDLGQYQNAQLQQQRFRDGQIRNQSQSPGVQQGSYHVSPVVPAKRGRPGDDNAGLSSTPQQSNPTASRSQTPQQNPYAPSYTSVQGRPSLQAQTPFTQTPNPNPSQQSPNPTMQQEPYRPQSVAQPPQYGSNGHPNHSYPQADGAMNNMAMPPNMAGHPFHGGSPGQGGMMGHYPGAQYPGPRPMPMNPQMQEMQRQQQQQYQMRMQQQAQAQAQAQAQQQQQQQHGIGAPHGGMPNPGNPAWNQRMNGHPNERMMPPNGQNRKVKHTTEEQVRHFAVGLNRFMHESGRQINPNPMACGRPIQYFHLFQAVAKFFRVRDDQRWVFIAQFLGFALDQFPQAPLEIKSVFEQNLAAYFNRYIQHQKQQVQKQQAGQMMMGGAGSPGQIPQSAGQAPPTMDPMSPHRQLSPSTTNAPKANGSTVHPQPQQNAQVNAARQRTASIGKPPQPSPRQIKQQTPVPEQLAPPDDSPQVTAKPEAAPESDEQTLGPIYQPVARMLQTHGGYDLGALLPAANEIARLRAPTPTLDESGPIDIHSLIMSLQSGFPNEIRYALDDVVLLSKEHIQLRECEDLLETLIDLAEDSLDVLAKATKDASKTTHLDSFEKTYQACRVELKALQHRSHFGDKDYRLDRSVERILAVTIILRNLSFLEGNSEVLSRSDIVHFVTTAVKLMEKKRWIFQTAQNTAEFMKDIVVLLSNTADAIELRSEDEALALLKFLLCFGPATTPSTSSNSETSFAPYEPKKHQYLPCAVDSLAKLLARDEPNRTYFKQIFNNEPSSSPIHSLLTHAFALAVAPIPDRSKLPINGAMPNVAVEMSKSRLAFFSQGMLAADILSSLLSSTDNALAQTWLESGDSWATNLLHLTLELAAIESRNPPTRHQTTHRVVEEKGYFSIIITRALSMLNRLIERAESSDEGAGCPNMMTFICSNDMAVNALSSPHLSADVFKQLANFFKLAI